MKKILLFTIVAMSFAGCTKVPYLAQSKIVDYHKYYNSGFFITESSSVNFEYEPIGSIVISMRSGYEVRQSTGRNKRRGIITYNKRPTMVTEEDVLNEVRSRCEALGGNGIINMSLSYSSSSMKNNIWTGDSAETGVTITVTGMAIKKK